jgi:hypothetical protein
MHLAALPRCFELVDRHDVLADASAIAGVFGEAVGSR